MNLKYKWGLGLAILTLLFCSVMGWRATQQNLSSIQNLESQARLEQAGVFAESFSLKAQNYINELLYNAEKLAELRNNGERIASSLNQSSFIALSELKKVNSESWGVSWFKVRSNEFEFINAPDVESFVNRIGLEQNYSKGFWSRLNYKKLSKKYLVVIYKQGSRAYIGVLPQLAFSSLAYLSSDQHIGYVVNDKGTAISYPETKYVGERLNNKISQKIAEADEAGFLAYESSSKSWSFSGFKSVEGSNLFAVSNKEYFVKGFFSSFISILPSGFLFWVFAFALWSYFFSPLIKGLTFLESELDSAIEGKALRALNPNFKSLRPLHEKILTLKNNGPVQTKTIVKEERINLSKVDLNQSLSSLVGEIKGPISVVLGQLQSLKKQNLEKKIFEDLTIVEQEARFVHRLLQKVDHRTSESLSEHSVLNFTQMIESSIDSFFDKIKELNIQVESNLADRAMVKAPKEALVLFIEKIIGHSINSMSESLERRLELNLSEDKAHWSLVIHDTGSELEEINMLSDSLSTQKDDSGMGLCIAKSIVQRFGGEMSVSTASRGRTTKILIPKYIKEIIKTKETSKMTSNLVLDSLEFEVPTEAKDLLKFSDLSEESFLKNKDEFSFKSFKSGEERMNVNIRKPKVKPRSEK